MQFLEILHVAMIIFCIFWFVLTIYSDEGTIPDVIMSVVCAILSGVAVYHEGMTAFVIGIIFATTLGVCAFKSFFGREPDFSGIIQAPLCILYSIALFQYTF